MTNELSPAGQPRAGDDRTTFWQRHGQRLAVLLFWLLLLASYQWYAWRQDLSPLAALGQLSDLLTGSALGPLLFILIYALRPLVLFPATVLTLGAGFLFGPWLGILYTVIGSNLSATVAYLVGRLFGRGLLEGEQSAGIVQRYTERLRRSSFATVLTMRFLFLPYDLVNYLAGFLRIAYGPFILATILGSIPGTIAFVLAGASIEGDLTGGLPGFDPRVFAASALIFVSSLLISRYIKRREQQATPDERA